MPTSRLSNMVTSKNYSNTRVHSQLDLPSTRARSGTNLQAYLVGRGAVAPRPGFLFVGLTRKQAPAALPGSSKSKLFGTRIVRFVQYPHYVVNVLYVSVHDRLC